MPIFNRYNVSCRLHQAPFPDFLHTGKKNIWQLRANNKHHSPLHRKWNVNTICNRKSQISEYESSLIRRAVRIPARFEPTVSFFTEIQSYIIRISIDNALLHINLGRHEFEFSLISIYIYIMWKSFVNDYLTLADS